MYKFAIGACYDKACFLVPCGVTCRGAFGMRPGQEMAVVNNSEEVVFLGTDEGLDWPYREERLAKLRHEGGFEQVIELELGREWMQHFCMPLQVAGARIPSLEKYVVRGAKLGFWKACCEDGVSVCLFVWENGLRWFVGTLEDFEAARLGGRCNRAD